ncbi:MAG: 50S ribosomal protein L3 [Planctomycetota bacterium]
MTFGILGKKLGMTQIFNEDGTCVPVTVVQAGPCKVLQVKTVTAAEQPEGHRRIAGNRGKKSGRTERPRNADGYYAVQIGFDDKPVRTTSKAELGHAKRAGLEATTRFVREFRLDKAPDLKPGDEITTALLDGVTNVDVVGVTKGRGWAGTIKRHNFRRQRASHGNSLNHRTAGGLGRQHSISSGVPKGKKMAGHMGVDRVTVQNLQVVKVDAERNLVYLHGAIPGHNNGYVTLRKSVKVKLQR